MFLIKLSVLGEFIKTYEAYDPMSASYTARIVSNIRPSSRNDTYRAEIYRDGEIISVWEKGREI
jgi:hypothetical protein